ncbi:Acetyl-CoA hydrolase [Desulforapulum autotrophicum HRM2]|uniref:Acetyl-CoA hydrolase n=1 Tax=Desulforapulum autotrophicum (strain ATCC 43914 / DSM 3382 / VKM B-1955 / HRM2) TaxID=177437 RepID=C0QDZ4_DESAH|nr:succinate CoA transferase [Desulforapulum autotrophicum]ACN17415.1 Acetyl-CoA hydrolase [Desulforapulum autotrophicum HRM2]
MKTAGYPIISKQEVVSLIKDGDTVAFSGFTAAGAAKAVPAMLAEHARQEHAHGRSFRIRVITGASSGNYIDNDLAEANAISWRAPYQGGKNLRDQINSQEVEYVDMHLSHVPQTVSAGFFGKVNVAVVEATQITPDGRVYLSASIGASPTWLTCADKVIIEINHCHSPRLSELADIFIMPPPPRRHPINVYNPLAKIGWPFAQVDPKKVMGIVENNEPDQVMAFSQEDETSKKIANHVIEFLLNEKQSGRIPPQLFPLQAGVGNTANAVLAGLGRHPDIPPFYMYSEVFQDAMLELIDSGKLLGASATALTIVPEKLKQIEDNMDFYSKKIVLRPQEISNHPGIIRRLGVVAINTALEIDIYGNVNSSHVLGTHVMNGVGGSGEFARNSHLSIFMTPSIAKGGKISAVVPMVPHVDNNEHSVQVVVTEQGLADLRGLGPLERAEKIINTCAHPLYRPYLKEYVAKGSCGHICHDLTRCFELHRNFKEFGEMLPNC